MLNYFNFKKFGDGYLITNDLGRYVFLSTDEFVALLKSHDNLPYDTKKQLEDNYFLYNDSKISFSEKILNEMRDSKNYLFKSTQLHIFVVTTACNLNCIYCQAQNGTDKPNGFMTEEIAKKAVDIALESPTIDLEFEFQGGEPLLNFEIIKFIVIYAKSKSNNRNINFSVVTNLTLITGDMIDFLKEHNITVSTSIDGNEELHNKNRPCYDNLGTFKKVIEKVDKLKSAGINVGAIQTTTKFSLDKYEDIIDTYIKMGFENIFLRSLTPLGSANKSFNEIGYTADEYVEFYKNSLNYILERNINGVSIKEGHALIFISKILAGVSPNYMELRSPCGASIGQIAYYYDGRIYTCDEGRMLAEMGDESFLIGNVNTHTYDKIMNSSICKTVCSASILESLPSCSDCVYQPYCGICPIVNYALTGDIYEKTPKGYKCKIYFGMLEIIFDILKNNDKTYENIFRSWF